MWTWKAHELSGVSNTLLQGARHITDAAATTLLARCPLLQRLALTGSHHITDATLTAALGRSLISPRTPNLLSPSQPANSNSPLAGSHGHPAAAGAGREGAWCQQGCSAQPSGALQHLILSSCPNITGAGLMRLFEACSAAADHAPRSAAPEGSLPCTQAAAGGPHSHPPQHNEQGAQPPQFLATPSVTTVLRAARACSSQAPEAANARTAAGAFQALCTAVQGLRLAAASHGQLGGIERYSGGDSAPRHSGSYLRTLRLDGCTAVTEAAVCAAAVACPHLEALSVTRLRSLTPATLCVLGAACDNLRVLCLGGTSIYHVPACLMAPVSMVEQGQDKILGPDGSGGWSGEGSMTDQSKGGSLCAVPAAAASGRWQQEMGTAHDVQAPCTRMPLPVLAQLQLPVQAMSQPSTTAFASMRPNLRVTFQA